MTVTRETLLSHSFVLAAPGVATDARTVETTLTGRVGCRAFAWARDCFEARLRRSCSGRVFVLERRGQDGRLIEVWAGAKW
jgi:hypothetical protein